LVELRCELAFVSWDLKFYEPIPLPGRRKPLATLRDAVLYMTSLPRAEQNAEHWRAGRNAAAYHRRERRLCGVRAACRDVRAAQGRPGPATRAGPVKENGALGEAKPQEGLMADQELLLDALGKANLLISEYIEPGPRDAQKTLDGLIFILQDGAWRTR
jgi:hypothetical protein